MIKLTADIVIVGTGIGGVSALMAAQQSGKDIIVITKGKAFAAGSTFININGRWGLSYAKDDHEKELLFNRITSLSKGFNNQKLSETLVEDSYGAYICLKSWGAKFLQKKNKTLRVNPCYLPQPLAVLLESTQKFGCAIKKRIDRSTVRIFEKTEVIKLVVDDKKCTGCLIRHNNQEILVNADAFILATGGNAANYSANIVEKGLTGDGYKLLNDVGVKLKNMECMQRIWQKCQKGLHGFDFPVHHFWSGKYFFKDHLGQAIDVANISEIHKRNRVSHAPIANKQADNEIDKIFLSHIQTPTVGQGIKVYSCDGSMSYTEILPFVQANNGGVEIGMNGETSIENLYAVGELTTGMHGCDRVGGMMICSAIVFARRAVKKIMIEIGS